MVITLYIISVQFPDDTKSFARFCSGKLRGRNPPRASASLTGMSRRMRSRCQRECEADVKEKVFWTDFGMILDSCLNDFGGHDGMTLLVLSMSFWNRFQMMRSLCQDECEADVKILRADVKANLGVPQR